MGVNSQRIYIIITPNPNDKMHIALLIIYGSVNNGTLHFSFLFFFDNTCYLALAMQGGG